MSDTGLSARVRARRLAIGLLTLLLVDVIWVGSSELTEFIFKYQKFNKPFFSTYLKTSLFMLYLPGFLVYRPWREQCRAGPARRRAGEGAAGYTRVAPDSDTGEEGEEQGEADTEEEGEGGATVRRSLSEPTFLPLQGGGAAGDKASGTDSEQEQNFLQRKVRFSRVAEVREMASRDALQANLARLSYAASLRAAAALQRAAERLTVAETAQLSLSFSFLFFLGNYSYQAALSYTEAGIVNVLSASSCLFTLLLAAVFPSLPSDRLSLTKVVAVLFTISGVVLVSYSDLKLESGLPLGSLWTLSGAIFYSSYIVFLRRKIDHEDKLDVPMFFGFVGLFCFLFLWPVFFLLHLSGHEVFEVPSRPQLLAMLLNGLVGTVVSELLWLLGCFYTSSLIATLAISLTIPLTTFADVLVKKVSYDQLFYIGSVPMFMSFFLVAMVSHWDPWDPMLEVLVAGLARVRACICGAGVRRSRRQGVLGVEQEQEVEGLISQGASQET